jgi:hypothetical protein
MQCVFLLKIVFILRHMFFGEDRVLFVHFHLAHRLESGLCVSAVCVMFCLKIRVSPRLLVHGLAAKNAGSVRQ